MFLPLFFRRTVDRKVCTFGLPAALRAGDGSSGFNWTIIFEDSVSGFVPSDRPEIVPQLSGPDLVLVHPSTSRRGKTAASDSAFSSSSSSCWHEDKLSPRVLLFWRVWKNGFPFSLLFSLFSLSPNSPGGNQALVTTEKHCVCQGAEGGKAMAEAAWLKKEFGSRETRNEVQSESARGE